MTHFMEDDSSINNFQPYCSVQGPMFLATPYLGLNWTSSVVDLKSKRAPWRQGGVIPTKKGQGKWLPHVY